MKLNITLSLLITFIHHFAILSADTLTLVDDLTRTDTTWENGYQERLTNMYGAYIPTYTYNPGNGSEDAGKNEWPRFLAKMIWPATNPNSTTMAAYIDDGRDMVNGSWVGNFHKPFSCPGYALYFFKWKDTIQKYDPTQINLVYTDVNNMWNYLMRTDHLIDACCGYNDYGGKEFNSENFQWMLRTTGYLFAHELHNKMINSSLNDNNNKSFSIQVRTGLNSPRTKNVTPTGMSVINYFDGYVKNLTRALFSAGRVEWNSNNYWGHTVNPLVSLYEGADKCGDPNGLEMKKRAKACLDWMLVEAAIHYQDGFQAAADARAKSGSFKPFTGSYYQYTYPYFAEEPFHPTYSKNVWTTKDPGVHEVGFTLSSSYRPAQIILDIAHRDFPLPVEIQSAKPFYHIDHGEYISSSGTITGESPYNDWRGKTSKGRRFEFETMYIGKNFTLASAAVGRPDGDIGTYSELCNWRLALTGQHYGARMLSGNGGGQTLTGGNGYGGGRGPYHAISQFRNMMMQLVKSSSSSENYIWVIIPDSLQQISTGTEGAFWDVQYFKWIDNNLFLDMGNDVYIALITSSNVSAVSLTTSSESSYHRQVKWSYPAGTLGGLILEIGSKDEFSSFSIFVTTVSANSISTLNTSTMEYTGGLGHTIKMEFVAPGTFMMIPYTDDTPFTNPVNPAGSYPKVWGNGTYIDYQSWDSYKTVYGFPVLNQAWGSCEMSLNSNNLSAKIIIDSTDARVYYYESTDPITDENLTPLSPAPASSFLVYPNPAHEILNIETTNQHSEPISIQVFNSMGEKISNQTFNDIKKRYVMNISSYKKGIYFIRINNETHTILIQ